MDSLRHFLKLPTGLFPHVSAVVVSMQNKSDVLFLIKVRTWL
jgi:hypothetical protein